jgi:hypothetical protein
MYMYKAQVYCDRRIKTRRRVAKDVDVKVEGRAVGCRGLS